MPNGKWSRPWACATGTCADAACVGSTAGATSCQATGPGLTDCGPNAESCCTSLEVPSGKLHPHGFGDFGHGLSGVSGFRLDKYEVTVGRFRRFVAAWNAGYTPPAGSGKHADLRAGRGLANSRRPWDSDEPNRGKSLGPYEPGWVVSDDRYVAPTSANLVCEA